MSGITFKGPDITVPISFVGMYPDSTPMVKTDRWDEILRYCDTLVFQGSSMANFITAMFLVDAVRQAGGDIKQLVIPYLPGARQDRSNPTGDVLFTAGSVGDLISERFFGSNDSVVILDPHSPISANRVLRRSVYPLQRVAKRLVKRSGHYDGVIAPDKGAKARAMDFHSVIGGSLRYGSKVRDVATGKLTGFDVEYLGPGKHYLVVDDICDGGGTFIGLAEKIAEQGCTADLYVSHGIFSKGTDELKKHYNNIYTTDSLAGSERNDVTVLAVVKEMEHYNV